METYLRQQLHDPVWSGPMRDVEEAWASRSNIWIVPRPLPSDSLDTASIALSLRRPSSTLARQLHVNPGAAPSHFEKLHDH